jgi:hypothetical protein
VPLSRHAGSALLMGCQTLLLLVASCYAAALATRRAAA